MFLDFLEISRNKSPMSITSTSNDYFFSLGKIGGLHAVYVPLIGRIYVSDRKLSKSMLLGQLKNNTSLNFDTNNIMPEPADKFNTLGIFPTSECNLRCIYCYARGGETKKIMNFEFAKAAIDFLADNSDKHLEIVFHGGGEPTLQFKLLKKIREYANTLKNETNFVLQTNGVFPETIRSWMLKNIDRVCISCDGPPYIQDIQRPLKNGGKSSPIVEKNIRYFIDNSKDVRIMAVISEFSVNKQSEILEYFYKLGVKKFKFLSLAPLGRCIGCPTTCSTPPDIKQFLINLLKTMELADMYGMELLLPISFDECRDKSCGIAGKSFLLTPDGFVSPCFSVTSSNSDFSELIFGHFDKKNKKLKIDEKKLESLGDRLVQNIPTCQDCFMKWNCAGGCVISACLIYGRDALSPHSSYCNWIRTLGKGVLSYKVEKDLIGIKPFLEERFGRMIYVGIFNSFPLAHSLTESASLMLNVDMNINLDSLATIIIKQNPKLVLFSFKLLRKDLNPKVGKKIENFLRRLKSNHIHFIITKPLPKCLFGQRYNEIATEFRIPKNCLECLELFMLKRSYLNICKTNKRIPQDKIKNRKQIYGFFKKFNKRVTAPPCDECLYKLRGRCNGLC